jgi:hypothetical protein
MTAARADRVSFGCSEEAEFTYFGRALFAEALQATDDLQEAFDLASRAVAKREQEDDFPASEPQISSAPAVLSAWQELLHHAPAGRLLATAVEWPENNKDDWKFKDDQP